MHETAPCTLAGQVMMPHRVHPCIQEPAYTQSMMSPFVCVCRHCSALLALARRVQGLRVPPESPGLCQPQPEVSDPAA